MSTQMNTFAQPLKENMNPLYKNLYLYVPRASLRTTEDQVKDLLFRSQIGNVEYCDLVTIKDKDTKQPLYAQLFIKLACWDLMSRAKADFERNGSIKIYLSDTEFWMILPNKNPLPRTHVNTRQLAASTEKLFVQTEAIEKRIDSFEDEMRAEMAEMRAFMKLQQQSIDALKTELAAANDDIEQLNTNIEQLKEDNSQLIYQISGCYNAMCDNLAVDKHEPAEEKKPDQFDAELDELLEMPTIGRTASVAVEDGLQIPQIVRCPSVLHRADEDSCIFSLNKIPRCLSPIPLLSSRTEPETLSLVDIVLKNPEKAIASRDFCGNS